MCCDTRLVALRISWWAEPVEEVPVGSACVEQGAEAVVAEPAHPERHPLDPLDQVVDGFGGPVGDVGAVPGHDLVAPPLDRAPEAAHLEGHVGFGEVADDLIDPRLSDRRVSVVVDLADDLLSR